MDGPKLLAVFKSLGISTPSLHAILASPTCLDWLFDTSPLPPPTKEQLEQSFLLKLSPSNAAVPPPVFPLGTSKIPDKCIAWIIHRFAGRFALGTFVENNGEGFQSTGVTGAVLRDTRHFVADLDADCFVALKVARNQSGQWMIVYIEYAPEGMSPAHVLQLAIEDGEVKILFRTSVQATPVCQFCAARGDFPCRCPETFKHRQLHLTHGSYGPESALVAIQEPNRVGSLQICPSNRVNSFQALVSRFQTNLRTYHDQQVDVKMYLPWLPKPSIFTTKFQNDLHVQHQLLSDAATWCCIDFLMHHGGISPNALHWLGGTNEDIASAAEMMDSQRVERALTYAPREKATGVAVQELDAQSPEGTGGGPKTEPAEPSGVLLAHEDIFPDHKQTRIMHVGSTSDHGSGFPGHSLMNLGKHPRSPDLESRPKEKTKAHKITSREPAEKPINCDECDQTFPFPSHLSVHKQTVHRGIKTFKCDQCGHVSGRRGDLNKHIRTVHDRDLALQRGYKCPYCEYSATQRSNFKSHLHRKHPGFETIGLQLVLSSRNEEH